MSESLLASLHTRFKCSQEDIATLSLQYILSSSRKLNVEFNKFLSIALNISIDSDVWYSCQQSGKNNERPDMSGFDRDGNEALVCEMKFYAGLTDNQPNGYIERIKANGGKALVFVCPESRKLSLWSKLIDLCVEQGRKLSDKQDFRVIVDGIVMSIVSWNSLIDLLRYESASEPSEVKSDIDQLAGLCSMMDSTAFLPFVPEDFDPMVARKEDRHFQIVEELSNKMISIKSRNPKNPKSKGTLSTFRGGCTREIIIDNYDVIILYDRYLWMNSSAEDTPFWLYVAENNGIQSDGIKSKIKSLPATDIYYMKYTEKNVPSVLYSSKKGDFYLIALHPLIHATRDEVVEDMMKQILNNIDNLKND